MEPAGKEGPAGAPGDRASKKDKERSKRQSRRRWRKIKAKGEHAGAATARKEPWTSCGGLGTEWTAPPAREVGESVDWPMAALRGNAAMPGAACTPSVETAGRSAAVMGGES